MAALRTNADSRRMSGPARAARRPSLQIEHLSLLCSSWNAPFDLAGDPICRNQDIERHAAIRTDLFYVMDRTMSPATRPSPSWLKQLPESSSRFSKKSSIDECDFGDKKEMSDGRICVEGASTVRITIC